jgi:SCY1-like protein 1
VLDVGCRRGAFESNRIESNRIDYTFWNRHYYKHSHSLILLFVLVLVFFSRPTVLAMIAPMFYIVENYLDPAKVSKAVGPLVALLFLVKDRGVRGALLSRVEFMSQHLDKNTLNASVYEPLCSGFNDSSPALRELTLKATLSLVPYLSSPNMEKLSRYLVRLQSDTETSIRTNSVIFIAKIAPSLSDISREKMLLPAYARAMKDTFAPCRLSALHSLSKSQELFSKQELAGRVLPAITPLLLDPMANVRKEAFGVVNGLVRILELESDRLAHLAQRQQATQQPAPLSANSAPGGSMVPNTTNNRHTANTSVAAAPARTTPAKVAPAPASGSYLTGLSSWMSSSAQPDAPVAAAAPAPPTARARPTPPPPPAAPSMANTTVRMVATSLAPPPPAAPAAADDDGWGDEGEEEDGWGDEDDGMDDDGMDDPFANIGTKTTGNTMATSSTRIASAPAAVTTFGMDDDPFAAIGMKPATTLGGGARPKGKLILPKKSTTPLKIGKALAAPTKLKVDASEMGDGWDDF